MKLLRNILIVVAGLAVLVFAAGFLLPDSAHVERDIVIDAPSEHVFSHINNLREFNRWSPWAEIDPNTRFEFAGPEAGAGAMMSWYSEDPNVGSGTQEIIASEPYRLVRTRLDFGAQGEATAFFQLEPASEGGTHVVWGFDTEFGNNILARYFGLMFDKLIGDDYEDGLANLKALAEKET